MTIKINADTTDGLKFVSDTSGVVDIQSNGTTKMTVGTTIDVQGNELVLDADADTSIHADTDDQIDFKTGGTDRMVIDSSGRVGIGTSSPTNPLTVFSSSGGSPGVRIVNTSSSTLGADLTLQHKSESPADNDIISIIAFQANDDGGNNTVYGQIRCTATDVTDTTEDGIVTFLTSSNGTLAERMRIDSSGDVGIGTTSLTGRFTVKQTGFGATNTLFDSSHSSTPQGVVIDFSVASPDNSSVEFLRCRDATTDRLIIFADGDVDNHDNSYSGFSDERLKEQITDSGSQWEDIKNLRVRKFKFKQDVSEKGDSDDLLRLGVIAQELESSGMGGLVSTKPEILWTDEDELPVDEDGNPTVSVGDVKSEEIKSVKYSILYMKSVKALQEAMDRIETLEAKVTALENN